MPKKLANLILAATVFLALPATDLIAQTATSVKPKVVVKATGHPEGNHSGGSSPDRQTEACAEGGEGSRASHRPQLGARRLLLGRWRLAVGRRLLV